ncbi:chlorophyllase/cutinase-like alpha/beta fold protein [Caviibacterium pharyngocola]|uniref:Alpha/beta hydrolase n=1 Tax=Caviibacterium pharyngocola TaxID=28159 RepID=A0A2M8RTP9_9PAST|nr:alpha/beta hydrolase [Caviibacterium pharyngocola]PJG82266.1 alpha/beta hydrolase [Caviibacterium pharyngocola]
MAITEEKIAQVQTNSPLEKQYSQMGKYAVLSAKFPANDNIAQTYTVYYPQNAGNYPLVVMVNGSGTPVSRYEAVLKHLASYGFVVIGDENGTAWSGATSSKTLDFALAQNKDSNSVLFNKINPNKIGTSGHSQGGVGVVNLATNQPNGHLIRSIYGASTTKYGLAMGLKWPYDVSLINVPYMMIAGGHESDAGDGKDYNKGIAPIMSLQENYAKVAAPALMAQRKDVDHGGMLWQPNGYMVAWFLYTLNGDNQAKQVFVGQNAEIKKNANWQNVQSKGLN